MGLGSTLKHAWNVFTNSNPNATRYYDGASSSRRPYTSTFRVPNERSIISAIYTRLAIDAAALEIRHVRVDDEERYLETINSGLNNCLTVEANMDQAATAFRQDVFMSLFENGVIALVPVDTTINPRLSGGYDILTLRVGIITQWYPYQVKVSVYNEAKGLREEVIVPKTMVAIIENPLYSVMNEPSSTLQRLLNKLNLLDVVDGKVASGKLDLLIQVPYTIKSELKRQQSQQRKEEIEFQLSTSQYGIAYIDQTEKVVQLNRPVENDLLSQIQYLMPLLYTQLGLTPAVMDGTADEAAMLNYWNRAIEPLLSAFSEAMIRSFLTKTARTQKQTIMFFRDPFRLVPVEKIAEIADKFTRNEIATSNEMRQVVGWKPHPDPKADQLINSNMPVNKATLEGAVTGDTPPPSPGTDVMGPAFDDISAELDKVLAEFTSNGNGSNEAG